MRNYVTSFRFTLLNFSREVGESWARTFVRDQYYPTSWPRRVKKMGRRRFPVPCFIARSDTWIAGSSIQSTCWWPKPCTCKHRCASAAAAGKSTTPSSQAITSGVWLFFELVISLYFFSVKISLQPVPKIASPPAAVWPITQQADCPIA